MAIANIASTQTFSRTVLITGGTAGLGYHCALSIAQQYPEYLVVLASRTDRESAAESINTTLKQHNVRFLPLDLGSLDNVRSFYKTWTAKRFPPIQGLLLNAGLQFPNELRKTKDGFESTFAVNHVGHALLFHLLYPHLSDTARIVITASGTHDPTQKSGMPAAIYNSAEELAHPTPDSAKFNGRQRYSTSKLANVLWTYALTRRIDKLPQKGMTVAAFDPGLMPGTGLAREYGSAARFLWNHLLPHLIPLMRLLINPNIHTTKESGANLAWVAMNADGKEVNGSYYEGRKKIPSSVDSHNEEKQEDLWQWTVKHVARNVEEEHNFDI